MKIILRHEHARQALRYRHPWIFRSALKSLEGEAEDGELIRVCDEAGSPLGYGFYSAQSKIACRVLEWGEKPPAPDWIVRRLDEAFRLRKALNINSDAYRLINAEGDFFPGLVIDLYADTVVIKPSIRAVERLLPGLLDGLEGLFPKFSVFLKRDEKAGRLENLSMKSGYLKGQGDEEGILIHENGLKYLVDIREGQKTGFYLDQRDNRQLTAEAASGKSMLNLFAYTGSFALAGLKGGATRVDSVDASQAAVKLSKRNYALNEFSVKGEARWFKADGFEFLSDCPDYDLIVLDPPPFARTRGEVGGALRGYRRLYSAALRRLAPRGVLLAFSCSGAVSTEAFKRVLFDAALDCERSLRVIKELHAAPDHPYSIRHPEGEYLKGLMVYAQ